MTSENRLLKILCLHGYRQSGNSFSQKIGSLRKALKKHAEFVFITAPHKVIPVDTVEPREKSENEEHGWWFSNSDKQFDSKTGSDISLGFAESLSLVQKTFEERGPFDGLFGFSQGAAFVGILCGMQELKMLPYDFGFAIMVAGFKSLCLPHQNYYFREVSIPTLHVIGETDQVISKERSEVLAEHFEDPRIVFHLGGHFVPPASGNLKTAYITFLQEYKKDLEIAEKERKRQIQVGMYTLEREEDSLSEPEASEEIYVNDEDSNSSEEVTGRLKSNKGGITKQRRRKMLEANQIAQ